jgi:hypothetical protein
MKAFGFVAQSFDTLFHEVYSFEESDKESVGDSLVKSKTKADIDTADDSSISTGQTNNRGRPVPPPVLARPPSNSLPANSILKKKAPNPLKYSMERESVPSVSNASLSEEAPDPASPIKRNRSEEELATESMVNAVQTWFGKKKTSTHSVSFSTEEVASIETSGNPFERIKAAALLDGWRVGSLALLGRMGGTGTTCIDSGQYLPSIASYSLM